MGEVIHVDFSKRKEDPLDYIVEHVLFDYNLVNQPKAYVDSLKDYANYMYDLGADDSDIYDTILVILRPDLEIHYDAVISRFAYNFDKY
jgi:hypothetical protein